MRVIWSPTAQFRGFFDRSSDLATVVSSNLTKDAVGKCISGGLTVVVDDRGVFSDFELVMMHDYCLPKPLMPQATSKVHEPLQTILETDSQALWFLDDNSGYLSIALTQARVENWFEIGDGLMTIGTRGNAILSAVVFHGLVIDTAGELEAAWLDAVESMTVQQAT